MAAEEAKQEEQSSSEAAPETTSSSGGGNNKLVLIMTLVNSVATIAIVVLLFISYQKEKSHPGIEDIVEHGESHEEKADAQGGGGEHGVVAKTGGREFGKIIPLEQFTVNLSTVGSVNPKFARVSISIEAPNADIEMELGQKMAQVRNAIIDIFNSKKPNDLASVEGRTYLKEEVKNAINNFLVTGKISGVFITNFAVSG